MSAEQSPSPQGQPGNQPPARGEDEPGKAPYPYELLGGPAVEGAKDPRAEYDPDEANLGTDGQMIYPPYRRDEAPTEPLLPPEARDPISDTGLEESDTMGSDAS